MRVPCMHARLAGETRLPSASRSRVNNQEQEKSSMDQLLIGWGLRGMQDIFKENGIDLEAAALLSDEMIEVLIPKLGARLKFKNHWSQYETTHMPSYLQQIDPTTRPQPFITELFSLSKLRPLQTFTVIDKECIPHKSLIDAVDVCYKAHFIIDCAYQSNVEGTWLFFQKMIYEQDDKRIRDTPALSSFRAYLFSKKT
ncbi:uncharacterized protein LOC115924808 [Strongylocentrotus purpuratus]|uniref:SAM domain-containing protein n=1 Tax=Strongylocentrotus purpuratus TaxID=7668 RepID=A0A7M7NYE2_STRPU|nr:uncharacterized protein LOC115924808 [Strongylocentrotus purpuratus]